MESVTYLRPDQRRDCPTKKPMCTLEVVVLCDAEGWICATYDGYEQKQDAVRHDEGGYRSLVWRKVRKSKTRIDN